MGSGCDAISLCIEGGMSKFQSRCVNAPIVRAPDVIDRPLLPPGLALDTLKLLFIGSLRHEPNVVGLDHLRLATWPRINPLYQA